MKLRTLALLSVFGLFFPGATLEFAQAQEASPDFAPRYLFRKQGRWIQSGLRVENQQGKASVALQRFTRGGEAQGLELPAHLGGGFIFFQPIALGGGSSTAVYRADSWTSQLRPLAALPFAVKRAVAGFDRLYFFGVAMQVALDPLSGEALSLDPLPPLVTVEDLVFQGSSRALVDAPLVGVLYTADAGLTWKPLKGAFAIEHGGRGTELLVKSERGVRQVGGGGELLPWSRTSGSERSPNSRQIFKTAEQVSAAEAETEQTAVPREQSFESVDAREKALLQLVQNGVPLEKEAVSVSAGQLLRAAFSPEISVLQEKTAISVTAQCRGTAVGGKSQGKAALFLCSAKNTELWRYDSTGLKRKQLVAAGRLLSVGQGAFLLEGACEAQVSDSRGAKGAVSSPAGSDVCWLREQEARTLKLPAAAQGPSRGERAFVVDASGVWLLRLHRKSEEFSIESLTSTQASRRLKISKNSGVYDLLLEGSLLPAASLLDGEFSLWMTYGEKFVGVRLGEGEQPSYGALQRPLSRAIFDGARAFIWGSSGFAKQSIDGGMRFTEVQVPYRSGDLPLASVHDSNAAVRMGCSAVGCVVGSMLRWGWSPDKAVEAELPAATRFAPRGAGRQRFVCAASEVASAVRRNEKASQFQGFWEEGPPALQKGEAGVSFGFAHDVARLYAYGPQEQSWNRNGFFQLRFFNPWEPGKILQTSPTSGLAKNLIEAEEALGELDRGTSFGEFALDPDGEAGLFLVRSRAMQKLYGFHRDQPLQAIPLLSVESGEEVPLRNIRSVVLARERFYLSYVHGSEFRVLLVQNQGLKEVVTLPLGEASAREVQLVRSTEGDLAVAMEGDEALLVYPLSEQGELGFPLVIAPQKEHAHSCAAEAVGYLVESELRLSPYLESPSGKQLQVMGLRAKRIVGFGEACWEGMTARTRGTPPHEKKRATSQTVPLSLLSSDSDGRRVQLLCE